MVELISNTVCSSLILASLISDSKLTIDSLPHTSKIHARLATGWPWKRWPCGARNGDTVLLLSWAEK